MKLTGTDLKNIGFPEGKAIGIALTILEKEYAHLDTTEQRSLLKAVIVRPAEFSNDEKLLPLANELLKPADNTIALNDNPQPYSIYGAEAIEQGALNQMANAMKLPITVAGALMPDAHQGYGLPIGGVLAT
ncbi:MAG: RtcB family protein, partial [Cyclobacteriaceae bacterium]|nr:RtcB family protein [Cyclobacteriaceae bacterium]